MKAPAPDIIYIPNLIDTVSRIILTTTTAPDDIEYIRKDSLWKPSEEQMYALKVALETFRVRNSDNISAGNDKVFTQIESLYKQLKKL